MALSAKLAALVLSAALVSALPLPADLPRPLKCATWAGKELCNPGAITTLSVNQYGGGAMQAGGHFLHGYFSLDMKLHAGNSGGVNFAWYVMDSITPTNKDIRHSELDMEFYGNTTAKNIMLATNVFAGGKQNLVQFRLPFDPSLAFHKYAMSWNAKQIVFYIDNIPIRVVNRTPAQPWPTHAMKAQTSVWATPWTALKADFTKGPVRDQVKGFVQVGCPALKTGVAPLAVPKCAGVWNKLLTPLQLGQMAKFRKANLIVDYGWDKA